MSDIEHNSDAEPVIVARPEPKADTAPDTAQRFAAIEARFTLIEQELRDFDEMRATDMQRLAVIEQACGIRRTVEE